MRSGKKLCPFCAEIIKAEAVVCKHCGRDLASAFSASPEHPPNIAAPPSAPRCAAPLAATATVEACEAADTLAALVEKSLVMWDESTGRYRLLESVRQYAHDRLAESGEREEESWRIRHLYHFLALAEEGYDKRFTNKAPALMDALEREHDNCRAAIDFCANSTDPEAQMRLSGAMGWFWYIRGHLREGRVRLDAALSRPNIHEITAPRALALNRAGLLAIMQNDPDAARTLFEQSGEMWRTLGEKQPLALVLNNMGVTERQELRYDLAQAFFDESLALMRELNDRAGMALLVNNLGALARLQNDLVRARQLLEESVTLCRETGNLYVLEEALGFLAQIAMQQGDYATARAQFREVLKLCEPSLSEASLIEVLEPMAELSACLYRPENGARLFAAASAMRERHGTPVNPDDHAEYDRREQLLRAALEEEVFAEEWSVGLGLTAEEALAMAIALMQDHST